MLSVIPEFQIRASWTARIVYFLVALILFCAQTAFSAPKCSDVVGFRINQKPIEDLSAGDLLFILKQERSGTDQNFNFMAFYHPKKKSLELRVNLIDYKAGERSAIKGHEAYKEMMDYFASKDVKSIEGNWSQSDNSAAYIRNRNIHKMTPEEAALNTWSGKQAASYGYKHPRVVFDGVSENSNGLKVRQISVDFYKSPPRTGWRGFLFGP